MGGVAEQRDAADEGWSEPCGRAIVGTIIVLEGKVVHPSQLIASVRQTKGNRAMLGAVVSMVLLAATPVSVSGTWGHGDPEKGGGRLLTKLVGGDVQFQLECWRGAPSYNSGFLSGQFRVMNDRGSFRSRGPGGACELEFLFSANEATVRYIGDSRECGFGQGVYANGRYRRTSGKAPQFSRGDPRLQ